MDPFVGEIRMFPFSFAPRGWAWCDGQLLPISQNTALFSILGSTYGGNGQNTFALPNLQGRAAMQPGQGPGLTGRELGETGGAQTVTLLESEIPAHTHQLNANSDFATLQAGGTARTLARSQNGNAYAAAAPTPVAMSVGSLLIAGNSQPHNNMMPYLTLNFNIALQGVFPQRP